MPDFLTRCERCGYSAAHFVMSAMNTDSLCERCERDEHGAPGYPRAKRCAAEARARRDYGFKGVGLSPEDEAFLRRRRMGRPITERG